MDKNKVKELYLKGYKAKNIAKILKCKPERVRQCIHRNLKEFKTAHEIEKMRNKEIDRVTRSEAKQWISDKSFILKNRSIYKTDSKGNIVLNKDVAPVVSFDTPRRLNISF